MHFSQVEGGRSAAVCSGSAAFPSGLQQLSFRDTDMFFLLLGAGNCELKSEPTEMMLPCLAGKQTSVSMAWSFVLRVTADLVWGISLPALLSVTQIMNQEEGKTPVV